MGGGGGFGGWRIREMRRTDKQESLTEKATKKKKKKSHGIQIMWLHVCIIKKR